MHLGLHCAFRRPGRLLATALAFTLAILVTVLIQGFADGLYSTYTGLIRNTPVDLWIGAEGVQGVANSSSSVPAALARPVSAVSGVQSVTPLYAVPAIADVDGRKTPLMLYGYDLQTGLGGPWALVEGRAPSGGGEIVLDREFARARGIRPGDPFSLLGAEFRVSGLSAETNSFMSFSAFAQREAVGRLIGSPDRYSFLLVRLQPGADLEAVRGQLPPGYGVRTPRELRISSEESMDRVLGAPIRLLLGVSLLVGLAVISLTIYSGVLERRAEYGVLRALGMTAPGLAAMVLTEVMASAAVGLLAGTALAAASASGVQLVLPAYPIAVTWEALGRTVLFGIAMAVLAAVLPLLRISRMDPSDVFRV